MTILVFDLDDTLLMSGTYNRYSDIEPDNYLNLLLFKLKCKKFIYTNGTYGHANDSLTNMQCKELFNEIYARDTLMYMKPHSRSFNEVRNNIIYRHNNSNHDDIIFFDDIQENLRTARQVGWITVWIKDTYKPIDDKPFINYHFRTIHEALENLKLN